MPILKFYRDTPSRGSTELLWGFRIYEFRQARGRNSLYLKKFIW